MRGLTTQLPGAVPRDYWAERRAARALAVKHCSLLLMPNMACGKMPPCMVGSLWMDCPMSCFFRIDLLALCST